MEWLESLILGIVQGVTEFLPVSSDGHLLVTQQLFAWLTGNQRSGHQNIFFDVMLHLGTVAAILVHYRRPIREGVRGFVFNKPDVAPGFDRASIFRIVLLAAVATVPLVPFALFFKKRIDATFESDIAAPIGFLISAAILALVSMKMRGPEGGKEPAETTWVDALLIGLAQTLAPLPGVSRSGMTIAAALALGLSRAWAVRFSLGIAVPAVCGAALYELKDAIKNPEALGLTPDRIAQTLAAAVIAGIVGYAAIVWLIRVVRAGRLWYFSVYLVVMAIVVLSLVSASGRSGDGSSTKALDRTAGGRAAESSAVARSGLPLGALDRPDPAGPRSNDPRAGLAFDPR
ncbi:undecaprenyl-diphosphate phosphatase [Paludisphaera borealis]|uniref:Undecaprenyl-diphosphatase n=1 Tax=Paludisphaera borealis TaxID=1387353 RepID=A0A1U7CKV1_9BACT|nr:undecaprenyl-diphosphate phosphatase [Paludisphaera borealis]APW59565.1 Undecaprenyl-diphosphatase [Paludisphaera borealis]